MRATDLAGRTLSVLRTIVASPWVPGVVGLLAMLSVAAEYELLLYRWSGHESPIISCVFPALPVATVCLAISAAVLGIAQLRNEKPRFLLGAAGVVTALITFVLCCLASLFFWFASGGGMAN
jgi:hypothetical protein